jgi:hypothetical protein
MPNPITSLKSIASAFAFALAGFISFANAGTLLPNGSQVFLDSNGQPLSAGKVFFYIPGTTRGQHDDGVPREGSRNAQAGEGRRQGAVRSRTSKRGDRRHFPSEIEIALTVAIEKLKLRIPT